MRWLASFTPEPRATVRERCAVAAGSGLNEGKNKPLDDARGQRRK
jgi:hypothetical protein